MVSNTIQCGFESHPGHPRRRCRLSERQCDHGLHEWVPACDGVKVDPSPYAALLGYYLGDGCPSHHRRHFGLRVSCDATYPAIIDDVESVVARVHPRRPVSRVQAPEVVVVQSHWRHWPWLFPQHGPGRKHERPIVLEPWQEQIVEALPAEFLRGLFHSDRSRVKNRASRVVAGEMKRCDTSRNHQRLGGHPGALLLGARPGRRAVAPVQPPDDQRVDPGGGGPARHADRRETLGLSSGGRPESPR